MNPRFLADLVHSALGPAALWLHALNQLETSGSCSNYYVQYILDGCTPASTTGSPLREINGELQESEEVDVIPVNCNSTHRWLRTSTTAIDDKREWRSRL